MNLKFSGPDVPSAMLDLFSAITDKSKMRFAEVDYEESTGVVRLPVTRFPLLKQRRALGNVVDATRPIRSVVTVRAVESCDLLDRTSDVPGGSVDLMFGITIRGSDVIVSSAQEDRGETCFLMTLRIAQLDIELSDETTPASNPVNA